MLFMTSHFIRPKKYLTALAAVVGNLFSGLIKYLDHNHPHITTILPWWANQPGSSKIERMSIFNF